MKDVVERIGCMVTFCKGRRSRREACIAIGWEHLNYIHPEAKAEQFIFCRPCFTQVLMQAASQDRPFFHVTMQSWTTLKPLYVCMKPCAWLQFVLGKKLAGVWEPTVSATVVTPSKHVGAIMQLFQDRRGEMTEHSLLGPARTLLRYCSVALTPHGILLSDCKYSSQR